MIELSNAATVAVIAAVFAAGVAASLVADRLDPPTTHERQRRRLRSWSRRPGPAPAPALAADTDEGGIVNDEPEKPVSFETDIKSLFRQRDRESMLPAFDLWSHDDVSQHADAILNRLAAGTMPCDGAWPKGQVDLLRRSTESGKPS